MKAAFLPDRGVVKVSGEGARDFLNGLVTTDIDLVRPGLGRFGALLTPQGKIVADFLITEAPAGHGHRPELLAHPGARPVADRRERREQLRDEGQRRGRGRRRQGLRAGTGGWFGFVDDRLGAPADFVSRGIFGKSHDE